MMSLISELVKNLGFYLSLTTQRFITKRFAQWHWDGGYYPPCTAEQAAVFGSEIEVEPLDAKHGNGASSRAQFYILRHESAPGADDRRFVLTTPAGMAAFQPCEILFRSLKERLARLPENDTPNVNSEHVHAMAVESLIKNTLKKVVRGCVRSAEHFRTAWLARAQSSNASGIPLSLSTVETLVREHRLQTREMTELALRDVGEYGSELDILVSMLNAYGGGIAVKFQ
eukprot:IDg23525t1